MMALKLSLGDVLEVKCGTGVGYVAYVGKHATLGDTIWVVPRVFSEHVQDPD